MSIIKKFKSVMGLGLEAEIDHRIFIERAKRFRVLRTLDFHCQLSGEAPQEVDNISESGVGLRLRGGSVPDPGNKVPAVFSSGGAEFATEIEIVRIGANITGARVLAPVEKWRAYMQKHFSVEMEAGTLTLVDSSLLKKEESGSAYWFFSPAGCELYAVVDDEELVRYHFVVRGHHFEGDRKGYRYGRLREDQKSDPGIKESHQIVPGSDEAPLEMGRRFLSNIERLPGPLLEQILGSLK